MITQKQSDRNSLSLLVFSLVTSLFLFTTCLTVDHDIAEIETTIDENEIEYTTIREIRTMYADKDKEELKITESLHLKGVVISDRAGKNSPAQKEGFIQDDDGDGLCFRVSQSSHSFDMGDQLSINLENATVIIYRGILQINFSNKDATVMNNNVTIAPKILTIDEIQNGMYDATLVKIKDVQFKDFEDLCYYEKGLGTNRILENSNDDNIIVRTTKYASFKNEPLPTGKGDVIGIASLNDETWHLVVRNLDDVKEMSNDKSTRFTATFPSIEGSKITIADLRATITDDVAYDKDCYIEGEVILNPYKRNIPDSLVYFADKTAGIALSFTDKENILKNVPIGAKAKIGLKGVKAKIVNGLLHIGESNTLTTESIEIIETTPSATLEPKLVTIESVLAGEYQSELVKIENVQFDEINLKYADNPFIINEAKQKLQIYTRREASFANTLVRKGMGSIVAVVSIYNSPQLIIRSIDDLNDMTGSRFFGSDSGSDSYINIDKETIKFEQADKNKTINITSNVNWTAKSNKSWLTIAPSSGSNDGAINITVNENDGEERKAIITITDGSIYKTVQVTQNGEGANSDVATDLFFSEYIKGTSNNKYLEIFNGTGNDINLSDYKVEVYMNGQETAKYKEILSGELGDGEVIVLQHSKAVLYYGETIPSTALMFNGNDAVALVKISNNSYVDIIGCIGHNPGLKGWIDEYDDRLSTLDKTLVRKPSVKCGVKKNPTDGFPTLGTEWIAYPMNTTDYLGSHTMD